MKKSKTSNNAPSLIERAIERMMNEESDTDTVIQTSSNVINFQIKRSEKNAVEMREVQKAK